MKYKFIGNAYLLGVKLNKEELVIEFEKEKVSLAQAVNSIIFSVKGRIKTYTDYTNFVDINSFVILDGQFYYDDIEYDMFELQIPNTIEKMAKLNKNGTYTFFEIPQKIEQLYYMKVLNKNTFKKEEYKRATIENHNLGLFYNDYLTCWNWYHFNKQFKSMYNEKYPKNWFNWDSNNKVYRMFDNVLQVKEI